MKAGRLPTIKQLLDFVVSSDIREGRAMSEELYHFCSSRHFKKIKKQGLIRGVLPTGWLEDVRFIKDVQWLTTNKNFNQSWSSSSSKLPYDRTEVRLTIQIPWGRRDTLHNWLIYCKKFPSPIQKDLNCLGDPENWRIFHGRIKPGWIKQVDFKKDIKCFGG